MKTDSIVIPQNKIDTTSSLLVDAHSLRALYLTIFTRSEYNFSNLINSPDALYNSGNYSSWDNMLALANTIQNMVLYDTIIVDSLLLQADTGVRAACELFPNVIKGVYLDYNLRQRIGERVYTVTPMWDSLKQPSSISDEHWSKINMVEQNVKPLMDEMTHVVPDLVPTDYTNDRLLEFRCKIAEQDPLMHQNLPDCCVNSSATLARTHYYLELAKELAVPLSTHPIRSSYFEILVGKYKESLRRGEPESLVNYFEKKVLKEPVDVAEIPISLDLTIPPIAELVLNYADRNDCEISDAVMEIRQSKHAIKFRDWCKNYVALTSKGRSATKEKIALFEEFKKVCETWKNDVKEEVDYKTRKINLESIPVVGGILKALNMNEVTVKDPVLHPQEKFTYFLLLNDLYRDPTKSLA